MKKILQLRASGALLGAENVVLELSSPHTKKYGYRSVIGVVHDTRDPYPEIAKEAQKRNIPFCIFQADKRFDRRCITSIGKYARDEDIDIVHAHGYRENIYALLGCRGQIKVATNHLWKRNNTILRFYAFIDSIAMIFFNHVVAVSEPILNEMRDIPYLNNNKLSLIANGIDTVKYAPGNLSTIRQELKIADDTVLLSTISSLTPEKGHKYLLRALSKLKDSVTNFYLIIIGDGPGRSGIEDLVEKLGMKTHVRLLGRRADIDKIHTGTDIYILPSLKEGLPMSLLEAMACGTACIASNVGDVSSCIRDNITGLLVSPAQPDELLQAINILVATPKQRRNLGLAASALINKEFRNERMIEAHAVLYDRLCKD